MKTKEKAEELFIEDMTELYNRLVDSDEGKSLVKTLIKMQKEKYDKLEDEQAEKNAKMCIALCQMWDNINDCPTGQSKELLIAYLSKLDNELKRKILVNIEDVLKNDDQTAAKVDVSDFFLTEKTDSRTTEEIQKSVLDAIDNMVISESFFENATKNIDSIDGFCDEFEKMNEFDIGMKSIFSMGLYLEDEDVTLKEAVESACMSMDIHEVCDGVSKGLITREKALLWIKKIVKGALIFSAVLAVIALIMVAIEAALPALAATAATTATATTATTATTTASIFASQVPAVFAEIAGVSTVGSTAATAAGGSTVAAGLGSGALLSLSALPDTNLLKQALAGRDAFSGGINVLQSALQGQEAAAGASAVLAAAGTAESANMIMKAKSFFGRSAINVSSVALTLEKNSNKIGRFLGKFAAKQSRRYSTEKSKTLEEIKEVYESEPAVLPRSMIRDFPVADDYEVEAEMSIEEERM